MFAILFEVLLIEKQDEIHHFAGWEGGGGSMGHKKFVNKNFVNKLAFPNLRRLGFSRNFKNTIIMFIVHNHLIIETFSVCLGGSLEN